MKVKRKFKYGRYFYVTRADAEAIRKKNERVYYAPGTGYYIVKKRKNDIWSRLFG